MKDKIRYIPGFDKSEIDKVRQKLNPKISRAYTKINRWKISKYIMHIKRL